MTGVPVSILRWMTVAMAAMAMANVAWGLSGRDRGRIAFFAAAGIELVLATACQRVRRLRTTGGAGTVALAEWWALAARLERDSQAA